MEQTQQSFLDSMLADNAPMEVSRYGYIDELGFLGKYSLPDEIKEAGKIRLRGDHALCDRVPDIDGAYRFKKNHVKVLQFFFSGGINRCVSLTGDTGTGKTSLIEQACARLDWPLEPFSSHDRATMFELVGGQRLLNGSTVWEDGPLLSAMRHGAVLLIDEVNVMPPEVLTGLNRVMERYTYLIPETGEIVKAHPDFRIAITGNALNGENKGSYKGVANMNIAFMNRFTLGIEVDWMDKDEEMAMLTSRYPILHEKTAEVIVNMAQMTRLSFRGGELRAPISPRGTIAVADKLAAFSVGIDDEDKLLSMQLGQAGIVFEMVFMWSYSHAERQDILGSISKQAKTLGVHQILKIDSQ